MKEKYNYFLKLIGPHTEQIGFFKYKKSLWKYNPSDKFVMQITFDTTRYGTLNVIGIAFGSFFAPIQFSEDRKFLYFGDSVRLCQRLMREKGMSVFAMPGTSAREVFEQQLNTLMPYFIEYYLKELKRITNLCTYLELAELFQEESIYGTYSIEGGVKTELSLAYYYLENYEQALRLIEKRIAFCSKVAEWYQNNNDLNLTAQERKSYINEWESEKLSAIIIREQIINREKSLSTEIERLSSNSAAICKEFFRRARF